MKAFLLIGSLVCMSGVTMAGVRVDKLQFNGTGCPMGSNVTHRWDKGQLVLNFIDFAASRGDGQPLSGSRKNCVLTIAISSDDGASFTIASTSGKGHANLGNGTKMILSSSYYFQGSGATTSGNYDLTGGFYGSYETGNLFASSAKQWSPCTATRALSVNTSIRLSSDAGSSKIEGDAFLDELRLGIETHPCY